MTSYATSGVRVWVLNGIGVDCLFYTAARVMSIRTLRHSLYFFAYTQAPMISSQSPVFHLSVDYKRLALFKLMASFVFSYDPFFYRVFCFFSKSIHKCTILGSIQNFKFITQLFFHLKSISFLDTSCPGLCLLKPVSVPNSQSSH